MSKYRIRMNGKTYEMEIELIDEKDEPMKSKRTVPNIDYKSTDSVVRVINPAAERKTHFDDTMVKSPMPGTVIKVMAKVGDSVGKDEPVLVLEAMKMENEICAPYTSRIKEIFVSEGETVTGAVPLFELEPEDDKLV